MFEIQSASAGEAWADAPSFPAISEASQPFAADNLRGATLLLAVVSLAIAIAMLFANRVSVDAGTLSAAAQATAALLLAAAILRTRGRFGRLADCLEAQGLVALAGFGGGVICLMGLRIHFPLQDEALFAVDRAIAFDPQSYIALTLRAPEWLFELSGGAYTSTLGILLLSLLIQSLLGEQVEAWRAAFCFAGGLITACLISVLVPAKGLALWLPANLVARLPEGAGRYFWPSFDRFYDSDPVVLRLESIDAVVSFPSFHIIMGLIILTMWRRHWATLAAAGAFFICMAALTVPLGGHYAVDLLGGIVVWGLWLAISVRVARNGSIRFAPS